MFCSDSTGILQVKDKFSTTFRQDMVLSEQMHNPLLHYDPETTTVPIPQNEKSCCHIRKSLSLDRSGTMPDKFRLYPRYNIIRDTIAQGISFTMNVIRDAILSAIGSRLQYHKRYPQWNLGRNSIKEYDSKKYDSTSNPEI